MSLPQIDERQTDSPIPLLSLFGMFLEIGALSFGGGLSGWVYREVVMMRRWMSEDEFMSALALSQILPGTNISNLAVCVGLKARGLLGACIALCGLLVVPFFAVIALMLFYEQLADLSWLTSALDGVTAAAIGLLILAGLKGGKSATRSVQACVVVLVTFVMVAILHWPLLQVVLCMAPLSVLTAWLKGRRNA